MSIFIGFAGIACLLEVEFSVLHWILLVGVLTGVLQAISVVAIRRLSESEPVARILFYYTLIGTLITFPVAQHYFSMLTVNNILFLLCVGMTTFIAQYLIAFSLRFAHASTLGPTCYFSVLFSGFLDWMIWHDRPTTMAIIGMSLVVLSGFALVYLSRSRVRQICPEEESNL